MKKFLSLALFSGILLMSVGANAQSDSAKKMPVDKSKRPSPPAMASATTSNGVKIMIDYSQPSLKGREIGTGVEPHKDSVWRTGANEATIFEINKDVKIEGKPLKAGKYGLHSIWNGSDAWTIIFNKNWNESGLAYNDAADVLRVNVKNMPPSTPSEKLTFTVDKSGQVKLAWGTVGFGFQVQ